jgi:hypothetical protein
MYEILLKIDYIGAVKGESKEDAKQRCQAILEELTKAVAPLSEKHVHLTVDTIAAPIKDAAKTYTEIAEGN